MSFIVFVIGYIVLSYIFDCLRPILEVLFKISTIIVIILFIFVI